jgi:NitT/TauT family transport system ATP-binding protein
MKYSTPVPQGETMDVLKLTDVEKTFFTKNDSTHTIRSLSFTVKQGEFVAIIGPSGCGKTTILSLISGIIQPSSGTIEVFGSPPPSNRIGYMLQHDHLFEWRTIYRNVILGLEIQHGLNEKTISQAVSLLKKYGLGDFMNHYPYQLSGGMRQRAALIRTLALDPDILLLDEPFSSLDSQTRLAVCDDVYGIIKKEAKTAILVTHDIAEAVSTADRIFVLTKRPATIKSEHKTGLEHIPSPIKRRDTPQFSDKFSQIWQELHNEEHING